MTTLTVIALDVDSGANGTVTYSLMHVPTKNGRPLFAIDPSTGLITTLVSNALDREAEPVHYLTVVARDKGIPHLSCELVS